MLLDDERTMLEAAGLRLGTKTAGTSAGNCESVDMRDETSGVSLGSIETGVLSAGTAVCAAAAVGITLET